MTTEATFKEELTDVLVAHGNRWMTIRELADAVNLTDRYWKKDHSALTPYDVHIRARHYPIIFERGGTSLRLSNPSLR